MLGGIFDTVPSLQLSHSTTSSTTIFDFVKTPPLNITKIPRWYLF